MKEAWLQTEWGLQQLWMWTKCGAIAKIYIKSLLSHRLFWQWIAIDRVLRVRIFPPSHKWQIYAFISCWVAINSLLQIGTFPNVRVQCGVPQGSVLGPLMFYPFYTVCIICKVGHFYADDTQLYRLQEHWLTRNIICRFYLWPFIFCADKSYSKDPGVTPYANLYFYVIKVAFLRLHFIIYETYPK